MTWKGDLRAQVREEFREAGRRQRNPVDESVPILPATSEGAKGEPNALAAKVAEAVKILRRRIVRAA